GRSQRKEVAAKRDVDSHFSHTRQLEEYVPGVKEGGHVGCGDLDHLRPLHSGMTGDGPGRGIERNDGFWFGWRDHAHFDQCRGDAHSAMTAHVEVSRTVHEEEAVLAAW